MKISSFLFASALTAASLATVAGAEQISYFTGQVTTANATELGRASRSGIPQSWTGEETYTGQLNTSTTYFYTAYDFGASLFAGAPYVEVSAYDETGAGDFFVSAFASTYTSSNRGLDWLGDEGSSGNLQFFAGVPGDPRYFDVILPAGDDLILLVNSTLGGANGLNQPFDIDVAAYADTEYDDPAVSTAATPEPGTLLLTMSGLLGAAGVMRRRVMGRV